MNSVLAYFTRALALIGPITQGIQALAGEKDVATKTQLAQDALTLAVGAAQVVLPSTDSATIATVGNSVSTALAAAVAAEHAIAAQATS